MVQKNTFDDTYTCEGSGTSVVEFECVYGAYAESQEIGSTTNIDELEFVG